MPMPNPNEWKNGKQLKILSDLWKFSVLETWDIFARKLQWESFTPFGIPSEPEVYNITAGLLNLSSVNLLEVFKDKNNFKVLRKEETIFLDI